jgi:hypothetical protein
MTKQQKPTQRGRGRPPKYGKRRNFNFRLSEEVRQHLIESAARTGRSLSEELEFRVSRDIGWEATKNDIEEMKRRAALWEDASRVKAIRAAGLTILREIEGDQQESDLDLRRYSRKLIGLCTGCGLGLSTRSNSAGRFGTASHDQRGSRPRAGSNRRTKRQIEAHENGWRRKITARGNGGVR